MAGRISKWKQVDKKLSDNTVGVLGKLGPAQALLNYSFVSWFINDHFSKCLGFG